MSSLQEAIQKIFKAFVFRGSQKKYAARQEWLRKQRMRYSPMDDEPNLVDDQRHKDMRVRQQKEDLDERVEQAIQKASDLKKNTPLDSEFLGTDIEYPESKVRRFFFRRPAPDLTEIRDDLDSFSKIEKIATTRKKINRLLRSHPFNAEVRALNAILMYNDTLQTGLEDKKLEALKAAVVEMSIAIHNGGISIYHINWFIRMYLRYLETLQRKLLMEYNTAMSNFHWRVRKAGGELHQVMIQVTSMLGIRENLTGMTMLSTKLKGSAYVYECLTWDDVREACQIQEGGESRSMGVGKSANYVLWEIFTAATLFARIPIFRKLLNEIMTVIPDTSRAFILQKAMVHTIVAVSEYQNAVAMGDLNQRVESATKIYQMSVETISQHLRHASPMKVYEIDPYLKAAWITKESNGLFERDEYHAMLEQALNYLTIVLQTPEPTKGSYELAKQLQDDILEIMQEYGWSSF